MSEDIRIVVATHKKYEQMCCLFSLIKNETDDNLLMELFSDCKTAKQLMSVCENTDNGKYKWENISSIK